MIAPVLAGLLALVLIGPVWRLALQFGLTDRPAVHKPHAIATPYLGGAVVLAAAIPAVAFFARPWTLPMTALTVGAVALGALGLTDDLRPLSPKLRLGAETLVALGFVLCGGRVPVTGLSWVDGVLTVLWLVIIVNSMNLLDNSDAAFSLTAIASMAFLALASGGGLAILLLSFAAAVAGFLSYNWPPARMFLGDAGSLSLGYLIAGATVLLTASLAPGPSPVALLILATVVATADTATVVISRLRAGHSILDGGADHLSHRLQRLGLSKKASALTLSAITATAGLAAVVAFPNLPATATATAANGVGAGITGSTRTTSDTGITDSAGTTSGTGFAGGAGTTGGTVIAEGAANAGSANGAESAGLLGFHGWPLLAIAMISVALIVALALRISPGYTNVRATPDSAGRQDIAEQKHARQSAGPEQTRQSTGQAQAREGAGSEGAGESPEHGAVPEASLLQHGDRYSESVSSAR